MTLIKLIFVVTTLTLQRNKAQGEMFVSQGDVKDQGLKVADKRIDNFRVPVDMTYDPNFWPARGRRGGGIESVDNIQNENCVTSDENFVYDKGGCLRVLETGKPKDAVDFRKELVERACFGSAGSSEEAREECRRKWRRTIPEELERSLLHRVGAEVDRRRYKKQRQFGTPGVVWSYGDGFYWTLDNSYGEKKKKQDVFWVARGKKNP